MMFVVWMVERRSRAGDAVARSTMGLGLRALSCLVMLAALGMAACNDGDVPARSPEPAPPRVRVRTQDEPPGIHCERGGTVVFSGVDTDADGGLDDSEVTETTYVCDGADAPPRMLSRIETVGPGVSCAFGGTAVHSGHDVDRDGTLDVEEIESSAYVCSEATASEEVEIASGEFHECARKASGTVWCWGGNSSRQLGNYSLSGSPTPVPVAGVVGATAMGAGDRHTCAVVAGGAVWCWGENYTHQLGDATGGGPARQVPGLPAMVAVDGGYDHSCGLTREGTVWCWGGDAFGQSGQGASELPVAPAVVPVLVDVIAIAASSTSTCALQRGGEVRCWGAQIGGGTDSETCALDYPCHRQPMLVQGLPPVVALSLGSDTACAVTSSGQAWCWGSNVTGALGDGTSVSRTQPAPVVDLDRVSEIAVGGSHTCATRDDGALWCWGRNGFGNLATAAIGPLQLRPVHAVGNYGLTGLALGYDHACGLRGGASFCWGRNSFGEVGPIGRTKPVEVLADAQDVSAGNRGACAVLAGGSVWCWGAFNSGEQRGIWDLVPTPKLGLPPAKDVAAGATHACIAAVDGSAWCWGGNSSRELGVPVIESSDVPVRVAEIDDAVAIHAGGFQTCAERANGSLWCWGTTGELFSRGRPPTQLLPSVKSVALAGSHGCAVDSDHTAWCWGNNEFWQVKADAPSVAPLTRVLSDVASVSTRFAESCAQRLDGSLWCWGQRRAGPERVAVGAFTALEAGYWHTCMLRPDATAACFGMNSHGQLGDGTFDFQSAPVAVSELSDVTQISAGYEQTCAIRADASLWCWGSNDAGQVGDGGLTERVTSPTAVEL